MNSETPPSSDPLFGNNPSDLMREAMDPATRIPTGDPHAWQPPTPEDLQARLGGVYLVEAFLARGGMGAVYRGIQASLERPVAIKILPPQLRDADPSFAQRFKQEAKAMAQLNHPSIVSVYDFGEMPDGTLYFIMEFVDGTDVAQMVTRQGRLSSKHAMAITAHVCDALQYAHEHGVVHRDIKPANIMVGNDGRVKVADFGLAKSSRVTQSSLTMTGHVMGTPHFLAPEALTLGSSVDHRADIYAVGVMLYQMLTGRLPKGIFEMPSLLVPGLDPRYDAIITAAMREDRTARYQAILDMRRALDAILTKPVAKSQAAPQQPAVVATPPAQAAAPKPQPGQHYYRPPQAQKAATPMRKESNTTTWLLAAAVVLTLGGIVWMKLTAPPPDPLLSATKDNPFTNSLGMQFVPVKGTDVLFCIHEVRYSDYAAYAAESPNVDGTWKDQSVDGYALTENKEQHPVMKVGWEDAQKFCAWLSKKEGKTYRLPTDQEWSYAVGIGRDEKWAKDTTPATVTKSQTDFPWGDKWPPPKGSGNYSDESRKAKAPSTATQYLENYDDGFPTTAPVMSFKPNKLGLYDLEGNVREWVEDWYDNAKKYRVLRGGCWFNLDRANLLSSYRTHHVPGLRNQTYGFRCVIETPVRFKDEESTIPTSTDTPLAVQGPQSAPPQAAPNPALIKELATAAVATPVPTPTDTSAPSKPEPEYRTFTDRQGRRIRAALIRVQNDDVTLKREDGQEISIKGSMLSDSDIGYLKPKGLVLPKAPAVAAAAPAGSKPPAPVVEPPKPAAVPAPSASTTYGGMEFSPNWLPQTLTARRELLETFDFYCKAAVGNAPKGQEPVPGNIVGAIRWRMPIDEAIQTLPKGYNKLSERPMVHSCLPNNSLINCGFQYRSFQDRGQSFYEMFMLIDKQRRVVSVMFRDNGKDIQWFPKPDGIREPYYNMFSELTYNGSTTQEVPYQILGAGNGVTCIKTALRKKVIALPNMPNMPQMPPSGGGTKENVHWYLPAPLARSILDIVDVYRKVGVIR